MHSPDLYNPYLKVCLCWKVYFRGSAIKATQLGSHCSGTCLSLFRCCFEMVFQNSPGSRPTLKGTGKRRSSIALWTLFLQLTQVLMSRIVDFILFFWGGGRRHAPSHSCLREAAWPSGQRVGLAIQRSRVRVPLWPLGSLRERHYISVYNIKHCQKKRYFIIQLYTHVSCYFKHFQFCDEM